MTDVITYKGLYQAYRECRRRKRHTANTQCYEMALLDNLFDVLADLQQRRYTPTRSIRFMVKKPKAREIYAADFSDRVVHHWLVPRLEAIFEPMFIHDVYSNRKGKGIHSAVKRLQGFMQAVNLKNVVKNQYLNAADKAHNQKTGWFLQLDIANFFNSIDKPILFKRLQKGLLKSVKQKKSSIQEAQTLRWLCHVLLKHDATIEAEYRGKQSLKKRLPKHKQLGSLGKDKGLAIGNLTSQFFANVYLNPLDQFIKHQLKCRYYCRYVDDFILLADKPETLIAWRTKIMCFLEQECQLCLKEIAEPKRVTQGADFLGYITFPHHHLVRRRVVGNCREKLQYFEKRLLQGSSATGYQLNLTQPLCEGLRATLNSYWAHFQHANSFHLRQQFLKQFTWLALLFEADALLMRNKVKQGQASNNKKKHQPFIKPLWEPRAANIGGYRSQIAFFQRHFPYAWLTVQRGTQIDRFAPRLSHTFAISTLAITHNVRKLHIAQQGTLKGGLKRRCVQTLFIQPGVELCNE